MLVTAPSAPIVNDATRVRAAQAGDRAAFGALYEQYARMVHGILLAHAGPAQAEDLMQDVFLRAMQQLHRLREPSAFGGWLASIARHAATDYFRTLRPTAELSVVPDRSGPETEAWDALTALRRLPEAYRETLTLRLVEGMSGPEIAARTGLAPDSVRVNLCRGMKLLRGELEGKAKL